MSKENGSRQESSVPDVTEVTVTGGGTHGAPVITLRGAVRPGESAEAVVERLQGRADAMAFAQKALRDRRAKRQKMVERIAEIEVEIDSLQREAAGLEQSLEKLAARVTGTLPGLAGGATPNTEAAGD